jgi:hypothetical protein
VRSNGKEIEAVPLKYAGKPSTFSGEIPLSQGGEYEIAVYAFDPSTGNTGVDKTTFLVRQR